MNPTHTPPPEANAAANTDTVFAAGAPAAQSWGERYKTGTFFFLRNWGVNYFVNFTGSAALTYAFDVSPLGGRLVAWRDAIATRHKDRVPEGITRYLINYLTRSQLLLCGGHMLQPVMKWMKGHEKGLEFSIGHQLDQLQQWSGHGDAASDASLHEYDRIQSLRAQVAQGMVPEISPEDHALLAKHALGDDLQFMEKKQSWGQLIHARISGILASTGVGILMALSSNLPWRGTRFEQDFEAPFGRWAARNVVTKTPGIRTVFRKNPELIGRYFFNDMFLTLAAKTCYDITEKRQQARDDAAARHAPTPGAASNDDAPPSHAERVSESRSAATAVARGA